MKVDAYAHGLPGPRVLLHDGPLQAVRDHGGGGGPWGILDSEVPQGGPPFGRLG